MTSKPIPFRFSTSSIQPTVSDGATWREEAACRTLDQAIFFPDAGDFGAIDQAKEVCAGCPVASECLSYAVATNQSEGIWGGTTPGERRRIRRRWLKELREAG